MKIFLDDFNIYSDMGTHIDKFKLCFQKSREFGISLNPNKCVFMTFSGMILGSTISIKGKLPDLKKIQAIVQMPTTTNPQQIQVFNEMVQLYRCFITKITFIMVLITKLMKKKKTFYVNLECQATWESIKQKYIEPFILIFSNWDIEFHVHVDASLLAINVMLTQNIIKKHDQPIVYASRFLNKVERNYNTTKLEALVMVCTFHKFRHYLLGNKFVFYADHMVLVYLLNKLKVSGCIAR